jgi:hypothetical protein
LMMGASTALANRRWTDPVRARPKRKRARVVCWWWLSGERKWRKGARPGVGLHWVRGAAVECGGGSTLGARWAGAC